MNAGFSEDARDAQTRGAMLTHGHHVEEFLVTGTQRDEEGVLRLAESVTPNQAALFAPHFLRLSEVNIEPFAVHGGVKKAEIVEIAAILISMAETD